MISSKPTRNIREKEEDPMWQKLKDGVRKNQGLLDDHNRRWLGAYREHGGRIFCGKGCRNCCNLAVHATFAEALVVAEGLTAGQADSVERHVLRLQEHLPGVGDLAAYLKLHRRAIGFCPFLDQAGACGVYAERPFSCRSLFSTRPDDWCGVDLGTLDPWDRTLYLDSLDPTVVAFPTHYAASPQERGREFEDRSADNMREAFGFSLCGNLTILIHLERALVLSEVVGQGLEATVALLAQCNIARPPFILLDCQGP